MQPPSLPIGDFDFDLPEGCIAHAPARPRDAARLLVVGGGLEDRSVRDLPDLLRPGDLLVSNDTRVIPAQLSARRGQARIGITLDRPRPDGAWHALARNARRLRPGDRLVFDGADDLEAVVIERDPDGGVALQFNQQGAAFADALSRAGALALPPYIHRPRGPLASDAEDYQTVFAAQDGAVAAPTAGLHFTPALLAALDARGIRRATITLHVGAGTFLPIRSDDIAEHRIHAERGEITAQTAEVDQPGPVRRRTDRCRRHHSPCGCWKSAADENGQVHAILRRDRHLHPARPSLPRGRSADDQLPSAALHPVHAGLRLRRHRAHARRLCACDRSGYRFYSYGDSSLLSPQ